MADDEAAVTATAHDLARLGEIRCQLRRYSWIGGPIPNTPNGQAVREQLTLNEKKKARATL